MASIVHGSTLANTTDASTYDSSAHTPTAGDLLVAMFQVPASVIESATGSSTANGITYTAVKPPSGVWPVKNSSLDKMFVFIANQFVPASPALMASTITLTGDAGTGALRFVARVQGMQRVGLNAIRQCAIVNNGLTAAAPNVVFPVACLTTNPVLFVYFVSSTGLKTPPSGWTELADTGFSSPTAGGGYSIINSGFTGTTITLGTASLGNWCAMAIEFDASAPAPKPNISTLVDTFDTSINGAVWGTNDPSVTVVSGKLSIPTTSGYYQLESLDQYSLTGSSIFWQGVTMPPVGTGTTEAFIALDIDNDNRFALLWNNNNLTLERAIAASSTFSTGIAYNSTSMAWLRLRETGGTVWYDTSPDGVTWTPQESLAVSTLNVSAVKVRFGAGYYGTESSPGPAVFDNINNVVVSAFEGWGVPI